MRTVYNDRLLLHEHADHVIYWYFISLKLKQNARTKTNFEVTFSADRTKNKQTTTSETSVCLLLLSRRKLAHNLFSYLLEMALLPSLPTAAALVYLFAVCFFVLFVVTDEMHHAFSTETPRRSFNIRTYSAMQI